MVKFIKSSSLKSSSLKGTSLKVTLVAFIVLGAYLVLWPVPIEPEVWQPTENLGYTGQFQKNQRLEQFQALTMGAFSGPEAAILSRQGDIIATTHEGWLVRFKLGQAASEPWVKTGGRPLGLDEDANGNVWLANAYRGLQKVSPQGEVSLMLSQVDDTPIAYADDVVAAPNGKLYFTDATMRFPAKKWGGTLPASILDIVEHGKTGRVIEYDPNTQAAKVVLTGLNFANGITADPDGQFILINETGEYRVWKLWIDGPKMGDRAVIIDNLPGFPDNINEGLNGVFWLGLMAPRSADIDRMANSPFWRKLLMRLPEFMRPAAEHYGMVIGIDGDGNVVHNLQAPSGHVYTTTGAIETDTHLYITSLTAPFLAKVDKVDAGMVP